MRRTPAHKVGAVAGMQHSARLSWLESKRRGTLARVINRPPATQAAAAARAAKPCLQAGTLEQAKQEAAGKEVARAHCVHYSNAARRPQRPAAVRCRAGLRRGHASIECDQAADAPFDLRPISTRHLLLRCVHACMLSSTARLLLTRLGNAAFTPAADHCNARPPLTQQVVLGSSNRRVAVRWLCQTCGLQSRTGCREAFQIELARQAGGMPTTALPIMLRRMMGISSCKPPRVCALAAAC
jgi:hypothetical protein